MRTVRPGLLGMLAAIVLLIALLVMRGRARRRIESAPQFQQPPLGVPGAPASPVAPQGPVAPPQGPISYDEFRSGRPRADRIEVSGESVPTGRNVRTPRPHPALGRYWLRWMTR